MRMRSTISSRKPAQRSQHRPWPRVVVDAGALADAAIELAARATATLLGLWGEAERRPYGAARRDETRHRRRQPRLPRRALPVGRPAPPAGDPPRARASATCSGSSRRAARLRGPGSITAAGASRHPLGARRRDPAPVDAYAFLPAEGEGLHQIPVGPVHAGIIEPGHFRFTANGETVVRLEERLGYVHKGIDGLMAGADLDARGQARRPHLRRQHRRLCACLRPRRRGGARRRGAAARASGCAR